MPSLPSCSPCCHARNTTKTHPKGLAADRNKHSDVNRQYPQYVTVTGVKPNSQSGKSPICPDWGLWMPIGGLMDKEQLFATAKRTMDDRQGGSRVNRSQSLLRSMRCLVGITPLLAISIFGLVACGASAPAAAPSTALSGSPSGGSPIGSGSGSPGGLASGPPTGSGSGSPSVSSAPAPPTSQAATIQSAAWCTAQAVYNAQYNDYDVYVHSNQPSQTATASARDSDNDAESSESYQTDSSGDADVYLYTGSGDTVTVQVGAATCSTTA